ncbi:MAG: hypothetical protein RR382_05555 [Tannerellaceae bacterium]
MKLINVLSILFFFAVTSCSMEDSMMSDTEKEMPVASDNQMVLSFTLNGGTTTKATETPEKPTDNEAAINNCIIFLLDNSDNVIGVTEKPAETMDMKILTKVRTGLKAVAIVNASDADRSKFKACATRSDINSVLVDGSSNDGTAPSALLKTGEINVNIPTEFKGTSSTTPTDANTITVEIPVKQRTARIELSAFSVVFKDESKATTSLTHTINSVMLSNQAISTYAFSEPTVGKESWYGSEKMEKTSNPVFYAYQNTKESKLENNQSVSAYTTMTIKYTYTTQSKKEVTATKEFPIITSGLAENNLNGNKVIAGCSYKIRVNIEITSVDVEANVQYEVLSFTNVNVDVPDFN